MKKLQFFTVILWTERQVSLICDLWLTKSLEWKSRDAKVSLQMNLQIFLAWTEWGRECANKR